MSIPSPESTEQARLRVEAEARLKAGSAPPTRGWQTGIGTLDLLYELASAPESADDALKLLHELQVHQVELDLQHEQLETTQRELAEDLARYQAMYELAPLAYLTVSPEGEILEGNVAAASLFGGTQVELRGRRLDAFLAPQSRWALTALLKRLRAGSSMETCEVQSTSANNSRLLQLVASCAPGSGTFLAMLVETKGPREPDPRV
ncbi:MAG: PAS domain-containing protein [Pseudomonadota bacterium]|nr:PAS domain-containing protein [Pseudomonadota bacterium]